MIINLPTSTYSDIRVTNISKSFTHKMAAKTNWHRYGTKLRHCHRLYKPTENVHKPNVHTDVVQYCICYDALQLYRPAGQSCATLVECTET